MVRKAVLVAVVLFAAGAFLVSPILGGLRAPGSSLYAEKISKDGCPPYEQVQDGTKQRRINGESKEAASSKSGSLPYTTAASSGTGTWMAGATQNYGTDANSSSYITNTAGDSTSRPSILAIFARYADDLYWLEEENTGVMDNSTGTPQFILPFVIYQSCDIGPQGNPIIPGLPSILTTNDSIPLPTWPEWARKYVVERNITRSKVWPGSSQEAEYLTKVKLGIPFDIPKETEEWEAIESRLGAINAGNKITEAMVAAVAAARDAIVDGNGVLGEGDEGRLGELGELGFDDGEKIKESDKENTINSSSLYKEGVGEEPGVWNDTGYSSKIHVDSISSVHNLHLVPNRGAEAMAYLTGIIDHYDNLPDLMLFMHAHRVAWHTILGQDWVMRRLAKFPPQNLSSFGYSGYMPLGCLERWRNDISQIYPTTIDANWNSPNGPRWHEALAARFAQAWREHFEAALEMPLPDYVRVPTAATFAVTKEAIQRRPKQWYIDMRDWILDTRIENKNLGIVIEFSWGLIFGESAYINPSQERCLCELYSICTGYSQV